MWSIEKSGSFVWFSYAKDKIFLVNKHSSNIIWDSIIDTILKLLNDGENTASLKQLEQTMACLCDNSKDTPEVRERLLRAIDNRKNRVKKTNPYIPF